MTDTAYGALSTPSSAAGSCPFNEWAAKNRAETQTPIRRPIRRSSLSKHSELCPRRLNDLDQYPEGDVFCRRCGAVLGTDFVTIHEEHSS